MSDNERKGNKMMVVVQINDNCDCGAYIFGGLPTSNTKKPTILIHGWRAFLGGADFPKHVASLRELREVKKVLLFAFDLTTATMPRKMIGQSFVYVSSAVLTIFTQTQFQVTIEAEKVIVDLGFEVEPNIMIYNISALAACLEQQIALSVKCQVPSGGEFVLKTKNVVKVVTTSVIPLFS